ncbi:MAG: single-stranded-DNA-specific exonuclease RecJ [Myxococcaceae bacterium]|nr:single-stranded-DNA-specific exonuclease RecJ [Myxococcaceae bacterium]MCI0673665.1 single-stranded-DNA-specific exonuclease RecJ [Myxococcaceae bacterium]
MRWVLPEVTDEHAAALAAALGLHPLVGRVLTQRGLGTPEAASAFLRDRLADLPDPSLLKGMREAVARLGRALRERESITLYGDYDVDGVCSTALLSLFLEELGGQVSTYIPHRLEEGYGLNLAAIERLAAGGTKVLVTLDCGITSHAEVARAQALGMDVVVVDHHTVPATLPPAVAVLNPHQPGCAYPTRHLCAAGVAFNLCMALRKQLRDDGAFATRPEPNLRALMDLVALATVADVVPLTGANRVLVRHGLEELGRAKRPGVRALKEVAGLAPEESVSSGQVGFRLGPRINAAGRLDDASTGLRLLRSRSLDEARPLARELDGANAVRQGIEQQILQGALAQAAGRPDAKGLVLHAEGWHPGVIGIVAARVVERYHRPTVVIGVKDGVGKGSARSIEAFHLFDALSSCAGHLQKFGGHKHAAGLTIAAEQLAAFASAFERVASERLRDEDLVPRCRVDVVVRPDELDEPAVAALQALGPFGAGNPEPVLALRAMAASPRVLRSKRGDGSGHLKLSLTQAPQLDTIGFGMAERAELTRGPVDLAFHAAVDEWAGRRRVSLRLKALRPAD